MKKYAVAIFVVILFSSLLSGCIGGDSDDTSDRDGDGVQDTYDACPDILGEPTNQGCPTTTPAPTTTSPPTTSAAPTTTAPPTTTAAPTTTAPPTITIFPTFTAFPTYTLPPDFYKFFWLGEWEREGVSKITGTTKVWIVYDEDNNLEVHYFVRCFPTSCYMGYFRAFYSDGDLVGIMNFSDRQELLTLERNSEGTISFIRQGFYTSNGGEDYEQTSTLEKTASLSSLPEDHYIESFTGMWNDFDNTHFLSSINITKIDPKTLEARVYEHCTPDNCYWGIDQSNFYPGGVSFDLTNLNGDELSLDITLTETGRLHVEWNLAYEGGGVAAGTQTLVKIIYL